MVAEMDFLEQVYIMFLEGLPTVTRPRVRHLNAVLRVERNHGGDIPVVVCIVKFFSKREKLLFFPETLFANVRSLFPAPPFANLLVLRGDRYQWRISPYELFPKCAEQLYKALLNRSGKAKIISHLGTDTEYWGACAQIVMRTQTSLLEEKFAQK
jgi:hypothetical protein